MEHVGLNKLAPLVETVTCVCLTHCHWSIDTTLFWFWSSDVCRTFSAHSSVFTSGLHASSILKLNCYSAEMVIDTYYAINSPSQRQKPEHRLLFCFIFDRFRPQCQQALLSCVCLHPWTILSLPRPYEAARFWGKPQDKIWRPRTSPPARTAAKGPGPNAPASAGWTSSSAAPWLTTR